MSNAKDVNDQNFEQEVIKSDTPVLVDFWAAWCGPCRMIAPVIDAVAEQYGGKLKVMKLNVDDNPKTAGSFAVMSIPTLALFKNGKEIERFIGLMSKEDLVKKLDKHV
ncbi:thioredoxin [Candidatus Margulisiibacteriota bacterium]